MTTDEDKISSIYKQGNEQGPPAHLDSAILKAAHEAVEQTPSADNLSVAKGPFSGGWRATASIAAVLVITVILVPLIEQEEPVPDVFNEPLDELQNIRKQSQPQETTTLENALLRKEKAKKRVMLNAPEVQSEKRLELMPFRSLSENDSAVSQPTAEESLPAMRSSSPAPASMAVGSGKLQQQELKSEVGGRQKSLLMMDSEFSEDVMEADAFTPQQWLDNIRQLIEKGEMEAAQKELDEFKLRYPDEEIDKSLLEKLNETP